MLPEVAVAVDLHDGLGLRPDRWSRVKVPAVCRRRARRRDHTAVIHRELHRHIANHRADIHGRDRQRDASVPVFTTLSLSRPASGSETVEGVTPPPVPPPTIRACLANRHRRRMRPALPTPLTSVYRRCSAQRHLHLVVTPVLGDRSAAPGVRSLTTFGRRENRSLGLEAYFVLNRLLNHQHIAQQRDLVHGFLSSLRVDAADHHRAAVFDSG